MPDAGARAHSPCSKPLALALDCRIWTQLPARLAQICNQQFPKSLEPRPVLTPISRQMKLNRNVGDGFRFGVIKGQRFPFRSASSMPFVFCCVTEPCCCSALPFHCQPKYLCVVCSSGESNAMQLPLLCLVLLFRCLLDSAPRLVQCALVWYCCSRAVNL